MKTALILAAGGSGKRFGQTKGKQLFEINQKPILIYTLEKFYGLVDQIIIVSPQADHAQLKKLLQRFKLTVDNIVHSGSTRCNSVLNGLAVLEEKIEAILIHDGARPNISHRLIKQLLSALKKYPAVIPVVPVTDTIKIIKDNTVIYTPKRADLFQVQTPQGFHKKILLKAYNTVDLTECTDDAMVVEKAGVSIQAIDGERQNIKITNPEDIGKVIL